MRCKVYTITNITKSKIKKSNTCRLTLEFGVYIHNYFDNPTTLFANSN